MFKVRTFLDNVTVKCVLINSFMHSKNECTKLFNFLICLRAHLCLNKCYVYK